MAMKNEGVKLNVLTELQNRDAKDILIACVDGLKGFPDAIVYATPIARLFAAIGKISIFYPKP